MDPLDRAEGLEIGADAYLTQPVEAPVLIASIRSLLRVRAAERAERQAATEWRVTFDAIGDAVALIDAQGFIRRCNRAFAALAGCEPEHAIGRELGAVTPALEGILAEARDRELSVSLGSREFTCRVDDLPEFDSASHVVLTLRDVTAELELRKERERMLSRERLISSTLQEALAPGRLPSIPGLELSAKYILGESDVVVGGDWFDVIPTAQGVWLTIGDNAGHGVIATARAVQLRNNLRLLADEGYNPSEAMSRLSEVLESGGLDELASATIVALSNAGTAAQVVCAGHPPALLMRADGAAIRLDEVSGSILGYPGAHYVHFEIEVRNGDTLILYTDGLIERRGELIDEGIERLIAAAAQVKPDAIAEHAFSTLLPETPTDDAAILVARIQRW